MAKPVLIINGHDYAAYVEELNISRNDLDAEGSGRDVQTGLMYRTRIGTKMKVEVKLFAIQEAVHKQLLSDISGVFYTAKVVDPATGAQAEKSGEKSRRSSRRRHYHKPKPKTGGEN